MAQANQKPHPGLCDFVCIPIFAVDTHLSQICAQFLDEQSSSEARAEWTAKLAPLLELISGSGRQSEYAIATVRELLQTYLNDEAPFGALPPTAAAEVPCPRGVSR